LDSRFQGVQFRAGKDPVLYLTNPEGVTAHGRRSLLDTLKALNREQQARELDPEIEARVAQYEMAYRMQSSVPEVTDLSREPDSVYAMYGEDARKPGTFAANCLLARRLAERGVRFIQLYHQGWDHHGGLPGAIRGQCAKTDQASAALVTDLKQRGMLDDTLVIWGGEFGRTSYSQGKLTKTDYGRDHHPRCFSLWMAGAGVKRGFTYGQTDAYGYNIADAAGNPINPTKDVFTPGVVHVHDLQATILQQLGMDHERLIYRFQGRDYRLTDVHGHIVKDLLA
jgi:arylsulfatase A-like enzyme